MTQLEHVEEREGWSNAETFHVALFYSNHESRNTWIKDLAQGRLRRGDAVEDGYPLTIDKMDRLEQTTTLYAEDATDGTASLALDLITSALGRVNYREIIERHEQP